MGGGEGALGCCEHALGITAEKEEGGECREKFWEQEVQRGGILTPGHTAQTDGANACTCGQLTEKEQKEGNGDRDNKIGGWQTFSSRRLSLGSSLAGSIFYFAFAPIHSFSTLPPPFPPMHLSCPSSR